MAEAIRCACSVAKAAIAEATSVHSLVESRVASLAVHAKARIVQAVSALSERIRGLVVHMEKQMSHVVGTIAQQLEKEIEAAVVSTAMTSERHTSSVVDGLRNEVKAL